MLDCSAYWVQCGHRQTRDGLKNLLQVMLGNPSSLASATCHWLELCISHFLYAKHFTTVSSYHPIPFFKFSFLYVMISACVDLGTGQGMRASFFFVSFFLQFIFSNELP